MVWMQSKETKKRGSYDHHDEENGEVSLTATMKSIVHCEIFYFSD
jgi:hypothetical protein